MDGNRQDNSNEKGWGYKLVEKEDHQAGAATTSATIMTLEMNLKLFIHNVKNLFTTELIVKVKNLKFTS